MNIEINNLKKSYHQQTVLDIEHLDIHKNVITTIVGPNGAGKSTLLNIIGDLLLKDQGEVLYNQSSLIPKRDITVVFQQPYLLDMSVENNIAYPLKIRKYNSTEIKQRVLELSEELQITHLLSKKATQLSLGEMQKVALARAISFHPKILLLDEPCASIDPHTTSEIETLLLKMKQKHQTTIILVTHNLPQAKRLSDNIVLLNKGKVIEYSDANQFFNQPSSIMTQNFIKGELLI